jgi:hypothetical protein
MAQSTNFPFGRTLFNPGGFGAVSGQSQWDVQYDLQNCETSG